MKVLFAASEAVPFLASGGLGDVAGSLPKAIRRRRTACRVVMPLYADIPPEWREKMKYLTNFTVRLSWRSLYCGVFEANVDGVKYYFIDNEYYFKRPGMYGYYDDLERFAFFSMAVLEMCRQIDFMPDILHANDWQTALMPVYYELFYRYQPGYENLKTVFTIHNIQYQGKCGLECAGDLFGIPDYATGLVEYDGCINLMKGAIEAADKVTTVSPTYAREVLDPWFSHGLDRILRDKQYKFCGFLNGIDTSGYNPETDPALYAHYSAADPSGKAENKQQLLAELGLPYRADVPLVGIVTRLVGHKGIDLVTCVFEEILKLGYQVAVLGSGEYFYEQFFLEMQKRYPEQVAVNLGFIPSMARKIYAGSDFFLMPSKSEPCGLAQMISLRYGTIPIVRETGGLADSVRDCGGEDGNGFTFKQYNAHDMLYALTRAKELFADREAYAALSAHAMTCDFSWNGPAALYLGLYREIAGQQQTEGFDTGADAKDE